MSRCWTAASLLVVTALYAMVTHQWLPSGIVAAILLAAILTRVGVVLGLAGSRFVMALAAVGGAGVGWIAPVLPGLDILRKPWPPVAMAALFAAVARLFVTRPDQASAIGLLPGLIALAAAGETSVGAPYGVAVLAWLSLALLGLRAGDAGRPAWSAVLRRDRLLGAGVVGLAAALAAGAAVALPPLSLWTEHRIISALGGAETGFSDRMWLGSLDGMLDSDEVVMRLEGPRTDYLRGAVHDHYELGRWGRATPAHPRPLVLPTTPPPGASGARVRVTLVSGARDRYFLPLGAHDVASTGPSIAVDRHGVVHVADGLATEVSFEPGGASDFAVDDPSSEDLDLPPGLRPTLRRLAREWTAGAETPEARVEAIANHLRTHFTYSRKFQRRRSDPLLDFLLDDHKGHCEYFASATVLLARAVGVPARVAVGYRVAEENALGGYYVVREKNAHAWAEVYLADKGFVTVDATPGGELEQNAPHHSSMVRAVVDLIRTWAARAVAALTLWDMVRGSLVVLVLGLVARWLRRDRAAKEDADWRAKGEKPPPSLVRLFEALARRGLARGDAEPIERFAERVAEKGGGEAEAAALLERWAAYRYGGLGDGEGLVRELEGCVERLRAG
jgi:transglutaminase-like putative cysteine protease